MTENIIEAAVETPEATPTAVGVVETAPQAADPASTSKVKPVETPTFEEAHSGKPARRAKWHRDRRLAQQNQSRKGKQRVARKARKAELDDTRKRLGRVPAACLNSKPRASRLWMYQQDGNPATA